MFDDMDDIEILTRMEKNHGPLTKKLTNFTTDSLDRISDELVQILQKYRTKFNLKSPIPKIRMWIQDDRVNFLFFDKATGKRVILGEWLENKQGYYEH